MSKLQTAQDLLDAQELLNSGQALSDELLKAMTGIYSKLPDHLAAREKMVDPTDVALADARIAAAMQPVFDDLDDPKWTDEMKQFVVARMQEIIDHINPPAPE